MKLCHSSKFLVLLCAFLAMEIIVSCDVTDIQGQENGLETLHVTCPYCDVKEGVFWSGENWTDSRKPCIQYHCDHGKVLLLHKSCPESLPCPKGLSPFFIPGRCCKQCELQSGDKVASLTQWSKWTRCSRSCGSGRRSRSRKCGTKDLDEYEVIDCQGSLLELEDCNSQACPIVLDM